MQVSWKLSDCQRPRRSDGEDCFVILLKEADSVSTAPGNNWTASQIRRGSGFV
jgi:hypothetical protein